MIRVILPALAAIVVAVAAITGGVLAYFTNTAQSRGNTFSSGTLVLQLTDDDEGPLSGNISASFGGANLVPGDLVTGWIMLRNTGSISADHVDAVFSNTTTDAGELPGSESTTPMTMALEVQELRWDVNGDGDTEDPEDLNLLAAPPLPPGFDPDVNGNGIVDLDDLANWDREGDDDVVDLPLTDLDTDHKLDLAIRFHPDLGQNEHQADSAIVTIDFTLNQHSAQ